MGLLRNENNFVKNELVRQAIAYVAKKENVSKELVEQVFLHYLKTLKKLIINQIYERINVYGFGTFVRQPTAVEKAIIQLDKEQKLREQELAKIETL